MKHSVSKTESIHQNPRSTIKITGNHFIKTSDELNLKNEARELERLKSLNIDSQHIYVPEFLNYNSQSNELTTRFIPSCQSFYNMMWNNSSLIGFIRGKRLNKEKLFQRIEELGQWLKAYHNSTNNSSMHDKSFEHLLSMFNSKINAIKKHKILNKNYLKKIKEFYFPLINKLADIKYLEQNNITICRIHGDFIVLNMLVDDAFNIHIIDFADTRIGFCIEDIGRFYSLLKTMEKASILNRKTFNTASNIFLESYGFKKRAAIAPVFSAIQALNALINCLTEFATKKYIKGQYLTRLELKLLTKVSLKRVSKEIGVHY